MRSPRLVLCSGIKPSTDDPIYQGREVLELDCIGSSFNVNLRISDVAQIFGKNLTPRIIDFLEIGAYVYAADCAVSKPSEKWVRDYHFVIPVRDIDFWQQADIVQLLKTTLRFLSDDAFEFTFRKAAQDRSIQEYLEFGEQEEWSFYDVERVIMFSGGLDSLAGALASANSGDNLVLVSHRSNHPLNKRQTDLQEKLKEVSPTQILHVPVWVNKHGKELSNDSLQRTRSFLFCAIGTAVAESVRAKGLRFFENGIVSINLPVADEVQRARASRTTHPLSLSYFTQLCSKITSRDFVVDNPFLLKTKTDVVDEIVKRGAGHLINYTCSCARTRFKSKTHWHCGTCSQCIDRRIAIIAAHQQHNDSEIDYAVDVFTGARKEGYDQNIAVGFVRHASELNSISDEEMFARFNMELSRAARGSTHPTQTVTQLIELHKRHGQTVMNVVRDKFVENSEDLINGNLPESSMLSKVAGGQHRISVLETYIEEILKILRIALPITCKTNKPNNEPHLQEICDGILQAHNDKLMREFPFLSWSASKTKPDWSNESLGLWIELKYVRKKTDIRAITEAIAADITKYGDNERRTLFVVYDPYHLITDEEEFASDILKRSDMWVGFVR